MPAFAQLIPEALGFFDALAANNNRDWFGAHKADYEAKVKRPAEALLDEVAQWLTRETGAPLTPKMYRIYRDVRFAKDKTPYNTHLHLQWSDKPSGVCHLFGVSRNYVCAGVGAMAFSKPGLVQWRDRIAGADGTDLITTIAGLTAGGHRADAPELKRVPAPYPQDHARGEFLRRKGLVLWHDFDAAEQAAPFAALQAAFLRLQPFRRALTDILA